MWGIEKAKEDEDLGNFFRGNELAGKHLRMFSNDVSLNSDGFELNINLGGRG